MLRNILSVVIIILLVIIVVFLAIMLFSGDRRVSVKTPYGDYELDYEGELPFGFGPTDEEPGIDPVPNPVPNPTPNPVPSPDPAPEVPLGVLMLRTRDEVVAIQNCVLEGDMLVLQSLDVFPDSGPNYYDTQGNMIAQCGFQENLPAICATVDSCIPVYAHPSNTYNIPATDVYGLGFAPNPVHTTDSF